MRRLLPMLLLASSGACSAEARAEREFDKYEQVFALCRAETEEQAMKPGQHPCAQVSSIALDSSLADTGLDEARVAALRSEWLQRSKLADYYIASAARDADAPAPREPRTKPPTKPPTARPVKPNQP